MPQYLVLFLPLIVSALSGWLTEAKLPAWVNTLITSVIVLGSALAWALLAQKLVNDPVADFVLIAGFCAALVAGPLKPLEQYLKIKLPSPLRVALPKTTNTSDSTTPVGLIPPPASPDPISPIAMPGMPTPASPSQAVSDVPETAHMQNS